MFELQFADCKQFHLEENPPDMAIELGKVKGSQSESPYCERSFTVIGVNEKAAKAHSNKYIKLKKMYDEDLEKQLEKQLEIRLFFASIPDLKKRNILKELYEDNKTQREVVEKYQFTQARISQMVTECIDYYNQLNE